MSGTAYALDALAAQPEYFAALGLGGDLDYCRSIQRGNFDRAAERGSAEADRHFAMQVIVVALEHRMRLGVYHHI